MELIRSTRRSALAVLCAALLWSGDGAAAPMGFAGSLMAMGDFGPNWREAWLNHAVTARDALGIGAVHMRSDDEHTTRDAAELTYTRRLARWNLPDAQANAWLVLGAGGIRGNDFAGTRALLAPGLQVDYETTRVYVAAFGRLIRADGLRHDYGAVRAGFSFYEAEYEETQPWLIVEARRMSGLSEQIEVTPMLRLINKGYFVEAGINFEKQARFNFMYVF